jgi:hypothetical protein
VVDDFLDVGVGVRGRMPFWIVAGYAFCVGATLWLLVRLIGG